MECAVEIYESEKKSIEYDIKILHKKPGHVTRLPPPPLCVAAPRYNGEAEEPIRLPGIFIVDNGIGEYTDQYPRTNGHLDLDINEDLPVATPVDDNMVIDGIPIFQGTDIKRRKCGNYVWLVIVLLNLMMTAIIIYLFMGLSGPNNIQNGET